MELYEQHGNKYVSQPSDVPPPQMVTHILARLGLSKTSELAGASTEQLVFALQDIQWEKRASAANALGKLGDLAPISSLMAALQDEREEVRAAASRSLGHIKSTHPISDLVRALQDSNPLVREAAVTALGKISVSVPVPPILALLHDEYEEVRASAIQTLGYIASDVPISIFAFALEDSSFLVREAAVIALGVFNKPEGRTLLLAHIQDKEEVVQRAIAQTLLVLEETIPQKIIRSLLQETEEPVQQIARLAVNQLVDLGLSIHEEHAPIAPVVVALQGANKIVEKIVTCYLIGRGLEALNKQISLQPLSEMLEEEPLENRILREGVWKTLYCFTQGVLRERKIIHLLTTAASDSDIEAQKEVTYAIEWLVELALSLYKEQSHTNLRAIFEDSTGQEYEATLHYLVKRAIEALEERETIEPLLVELGRPDAKRRAEVGKQLTKRAKKALMARLPTGPLIISLRNTRGLAPVELQFGDDQTNRIKNDRHVFPWNGPTVPKTSPASFPDRAPSGPLTFVARSMCK